MTNGEEMGEEDFDESVAVEIVDYTVVEEEVERGRSKVVRQVENIDGWLGWEV